MRIMAATANKVYSHADRAAAILAVRANDGNVKKTSLQLDIPLATLTQWVQGTRHPEATAIADLIAPDLADKLEAVAHAIVDGMPGKVDKASLKDAAAALAIVIDKMRLIRGETTSAPGLSDEDRMLKLAEIMERAKARARAAEEGYANGDGHQRVEVISLLPDSPRAGGTEPVIGGDSDPAVGAVPRPADDGI